MLALSWVSVTAVLLPGAVLRCLEPHRRISAFPKPPSLSTLNIIQHHDLGKQQKQIQHTILMSAVKKTWIPHVGKRGEHCVWHSSLFLPLFLRPANSVSMLLPFQRLSNKRNRFKWYDPVWKRWGGNDRKRTKGRMEEKRGKTRHWCRQRENAMLLKSNMMDKHFWVRGIMGNIYCSMSHFSLAQPVNLRVQLWSWKEEWDPLEKGQKGDKPERLALCFLSLHLCCFLSLFNLEIKACLNHISLSSYVEGFIHKNREPSTLQRVGIGQQPTNSPMH